MAKDRDGLDPVNKRRRIVLFATVGTVAIIWKPGLTRSELNPIPPVGGGGGRGAFDARANFE